jgi:hypothetical protein
MKNIDNKWRADIQPSSINSDDQKIAKENSEAVSNPTNPTNPPNPTVSFSRSTPLFDPNIYQELPVIVRYAISVHKDQRQKDISLLSSLVAISSCLPNICGYYGDQIVYPNLYVFISAPAASGKGIIKFSKELVRPIHNEKRRESERLQQEYQQRLKEFNSSRENRSNTNRPLQPIERLLFLPANSSASGMFQLLYGNDGIGLLFETEGDTLTEAFKTEYGNYSDGLRKAFHHETISYYRKTNMEYAEISQPKVSAVLSGTPNQIKSLIQDSENGLFSRFIYYIFNAPPIWRNVFERNTANGLEAHYLEKGKLFYQLYKHLTKLNKVEFKLKPEQMDKFNNVLSEYQKEFYDQYGTNSLDIIKRLGIITFRIAMILTTLRKGVELKDETEMFCTDTDFKIALSILETLVEHSAVVYSLLPKESSFNSFMSLRDKYLESLPEKFNREDYLKTAEPLGIKGKTAEKYIRKFKDKGLIHSPEHNLYVKNTP